VFIEAKGDGSGGDNWGKQLESCKAPVKSSPPTNEHPQFFCRLGAIPVVQPKVSKQFI